MILVSLEHIPAKNGLSLWYESSALINEQDYRLSKHYAKNKYGNNVHHDTLSARGLKTEGKWLWPTVFCISRNTHSEHSLFSSFLTHLSHAVKWPEAVDLQECSYNYVSEALRVMPLLYSSSMETPSFSSIFSLCKDYCCCLISEKRTHFVFTSTTLFYLIMISLYNQL